MKLINYKKTADGFTLIELLLYISISTLVILSASMFLNLLTNARVKNSAILEVESQGAMIMNRILGSVRNSESVNSPTLGSMSTSLSLNVFSSGDDPTIFNLSSTAIMIKEGSGSEVPLSNSRVIVSDLVFHNYSLTDTPESIEVEFRLTHINPSNQSQYDFEKVFRGSASVRKYD